MLDPHLYPFQLGPFNLHSWPLPSNQCLGACTKASASAPAFEPTSLNRHHVKCTHIHMHSYMHIAIYSNTWMRMHLCMCVCGWVGGCVHVHMYMNISSIHLFCYLHLCSYVLYISSYAHIYIYILIYININMYVSVRRFLFYFCIPCDSTYWKFSKWPASEPWRLQLVLGLRRVHVKPVVVLVLGTKIKGGKKTCQGMVEIPPAGKIGG